MRIEDIKRDMDKKAKSTAIDIEQFGKQNLDQELRNYYTGSPLLYERTYQLENAARSKYPFGGNGKYSTSIYIDQSMNYQYGRYNSPIQVIEATDSGLRNTIGNHGYWGRFESNMQSLVNSIASKYFG